MLKQYAERGGRGSGRMVWRAHDFILRLGNRDGWSFPLELDAWLIPETEYWRKSPETPDEEEKRFGEGPPNFRLISRATFATGQVDLTRAAADYLVAHAREILREQIAFEERKHASAGNQMAFAAGRGERQNPAHARLAFQCLVLHAAGTIDVEAMANSSFNIPPAIHFVCFVSLQLRAFAPLR